MIKKEYQKPTMKVSEIDLNVQLLVNSVQTAGLNEDLNYNGGSGNMEEGAMSRGSIWGGDEEW